VAGCATARNYEDPARPVYAGGSSSGGRGEQSLRVVTFNLKWGRHVDRAAEPRKLSLPHQHRFRKLRRAAAAATLRSPLGPVRVYGIHLESPAGVWNQARRDQARAVLADAAGWDGPVVAAGDFNGRAGPRVLAEAGFAWPTEKIKNTAGPFDFDHILARGLCPAGPDAAAAAEDETDASDHDLVWAVLAPCPPR
jgi:endonuclease/exonuclease/phosphatase (EEP) superfamily protein YafD